MASIYNTYANLLGGQLAGALGDSLSQQGIAGQQLVYYPSVATTNWITTTTGHGDTANAYGEIAAEPETNVAWLRRRVDEMRVALV